MATDVIPTAAARWPAWLRLAFPLGVGAATSVGFEPLGLWPLTLAGLVWLFREVDTAPTRKRAWGVTWRFGVGHFIVGMNWIATAFTYQAAMPAWLGVLAVIVLSLYLALFPALAGLAAWHIGRPRARGAGFVLVFAGAWILGEYLRATLFTGFAWNPLGVVLLPVLPLAHAASWMGSYGLSGLVLLLAGVAWLAINRRPIGAVALAAIVVVAALIAWVADGSRASPSPARGAGVPVRIVQPNIHQDEKYVPGLAEKHAKLYARLSGPPTGKPRLLLWPEAATLRFLQLEPDARDELATLLGPQDTLVLGGEAVIVDPKGRTPDVYYNSVFALDHSARILWRYDKAHLVPFGEYLPLRPLLEKIGLSMLVPGDGDFSYGPGPRTFDAPGFGTLGLQVCYEVIFSGRVIDEAHRPSFLFNPSNDAWFGSWGPPQHFAQARLRAIEEGIPVVRATPTGISGIIAADGSVVSTLPLNQEGVLDAVVPPPRAATLFSRWGLWVSTLIGALFILAGWFSARLQAARTAR